MNVPDYQFLTPVDESETKKKPRHFLRLLLITCTLFGLSFVISNIAIQPPTDFPSGLVIEITPGSGVKSVATLLESKRVVRSKYLLYAVIWWYHEPTALKASTYHFTEPLSVFAVADRLMHGDFTSNLVRFTHREGERVTQIADTAEQILTSFDRTTFLRLAKPLEGKLFPDTYFIPPDFTAAQLVTTLQEAYEKNVAPLRPAMVLTEQTEEEVIILASIIEREANSPISMRLVSGILQNRLRLGMALQVDASIEYILNKPLKELTPLDLKIDSPYNTYSHNGLPPTAIGNPGLTAITSVLEPTVSDYLYYITGSNGDFHYAKTFEEHKVNVAKYLE
jgi:UPF0755 protein